MPVRRFSSHLGPAAGLFTQSGNQRMTDEPIIQHDKGTANTHRSMGITARVCASKDSSVAAAVRKKVAVSTGKAIKKNALPHPVKYPQNSVLNEKDARRYRS